MPWMIVSLLVVNAVVAVVLFVVTRPTVRTRDVVRGLLMIAVGVGGVVGIEVLVRADRIDSGRASSLFGLLPLAVITVYLLSEAIIRARSAG